MQMLGNFRAKQNIVILYFQHFSKQNWNITHNIMCFIMNVINARQNFSANLNYLSFSKLIFEASEYVLYSQSMFWSRNLFELCLKLRHFHWKIVKIAHRWELSPQTSTLALSRYEFLAARLFINAAFTWHT